MPRPSAFPLVLAVAVACGSDGTPNPVREAFARAPSATDLGTSVAFRFPSTGRGETKLYRLPDFDEITWRFETSRSPARAIVGFASDRDLVYVLTDAHQLVALDLTSGLVRVVDSAVALAAISPTGTPLLVHDDGSVASVDFRTAVPWATNFTSRPTTIWAAARNRMIALVPTDDGRALQMHTEGQSPVSQPVPEGDVSMSLWGDAAVVATDSGLVVLDPEDPGAARFLAMTPTPQVAVFSASAHRLYVVDDGGTLSSIDRFSLETVGELSLPGSAAAARVDPWGRILLVRPAAGDSVWVVDAVRWALVGTVTGSWEAELPLVAPNGSVVLRQRDRVVSLTPDSLEVTGTAGDARDRWMVAAWDLRRPALEVAREGGAPEVPAAGQTIYVQVSSTSNPDWAADLASNLRRAGMDASVLPPDIFGEPYRVVLGPYPTREEAEATGRRLAMPFWIFTRDTTQPQQ